MPKFEYGDFYKFLVSLGVVLIAVSIALPWLYLREPFDLWETEQSLDSLTSTAQETIIHRQNLAKGIAAAFPWISYAIFGIGFIVVLFGLFNWYYKAQQYADQISEYEVEIKRRQLLEPATPARVQTERQTEARLDMEEIGIEGTNVNNVEKYASYLGNIQQHLALRLERCIGQYYDDILVDYQLNTVHFDVLLLPKKGNKHPLTRIVEVKYIQRQPTLEWVHRNFAEVAYKTEMYKSLTRQEAAAYIIVIAPSEALPNLTKFGRMPGIPEVQFIYSTEVYIGFITEDELKNAPCERITDVFAVG